MAKELLATLSPITAKIVHAKISPSTHESRHYHDKSRQVTQPIPVGRRNKVIWRPHVSSAY